MRGYIVEGEAIRVHPLVCAGFNADFDGDQMAVHVPLSIEAQMEARLLMMAPNNLFSPANGRPIIMPTQDITLGCYYLTAEPRTPKPADPNHTRLFGSKTEAIYAHSIGLVKTHDWVRLANPDWGNKTEFGNANLKVIDTTGGRIIFSEIWPPEIGFYNKAAGKKELGDLIWKCYRICGHEKTIDVLDKLNELGFREAARAGISIGIDDLILAAPGERDATIEAVQAETCEVKAVHDKEGHHEENLKYLEYYIQVIRATHHRDYIMSCPGCRPKIKGIWEACNDEVATDMMRRLEANQGEKEYNPRWLMVKSGARGNEEQVRQLVGLRGLIDRLGGRIVEQPVFSNFRQGLSVRDYFITTVRVLVLKDQLVTNVILGNLRGYLRK